MLEKTEYAVINGQLEDMEYGRNGNGPQMNIPTHLVYIRSY